MKFTIPGNPQPQARPRIAKRGKFTLMYDPMAEDKRIIGNRIKWQLKQHIGEACEWNNYEAFRADYIFFMPIPKSDSQKIRNLKLWGIIVPNVKPDCDNFLKAVFDACNKILYKDDCMIVKGSFEKKYSDNPRTEIEIMPVENNVSKEVENVLAVYGPEQLKDLCSCAEIIQSIVYSIKDFSDFPQDDDAGHLVSLLISLSENHAPLLQKINKLKSTAKTASKKA